METKLLPCPFCGKIPVLGKWGKMHVVIHRDCTFIDSFSYAPNGDGFGASGRTEEEAIEHWNTRYERTCDGCKHLATSMRVDYHIDPCCECVRNAPDLYEPKEDTDAD